MLKNIEKVIYWHRLGVKVYDVSQMPPVLEKEIRTNEPQEILSNLKYLSGQSIILLLSDSISYLYQKTIDPPLTVDNQFKTNLLNLIKTDIPEDFNDFSWDYKIDDTSDGKQEVSIFAPIKEFQILIKSIATELDLKIEVIETESFAAARDPNPIIGITKKPDLNLKDDQSLNLSIIPNLKTAKSILKTLLIIFGISILALLFTLYQKRSLKNITQVSPIPTPIQTITPTILPTPTVVLLSDLKIMVENGTSQIGLASKKADILKENKFVQIETGNADNKNYTLNKLIFKNELIQQTYQDTLTNLINTSTENISIDNNIQFDVIFILGNN
jgi:hypothetical protein